MTIRWYPAAPGAQVLPFPSKINSLDWSTWPWLAEGVGEVFIAGVETNRPRGRDFNHAQPILYAVGLTPCEPAEVFSAGEEFDPLAPPQKYDEKGLPLCCINMMNVTGGVLWGGSAGLDWTPLQPGNSCPTALHFNRDQFYTVTIPVGEFHFWFTDLMHPGTYTLEIVEPVSAAVGCELFGNIGFGGMCMNFSLIAHQADMVAQNFAFGTGFAFPLWGYVTVFNFSTNPVTYKFRWRTGFFP